VIAETIPVNTYSVPPIAIYITCRSRRSNPNATINNINIPYTIYLITFDFLRGNCRLHEVNLKEALEVEVRYLLTILNAKELTKLGVRNDTALEVRIKTVVRLHVGGDKLRDIRLAALALGWKTHE